MLMHSLKWFSNRNKSPLRILPYGGDAAPLSTVKPSRVRDLLTIISRQKKFTNFKTFTRQFNQKYHRSINRSFLLPVTSAKYMTFHT